MAEIKADETDHAVRESIWGVPSHRSSVNYQYRDAHLDIVWVTNVPNTDEQAVDYFYTLLTWGIAAKYIEVKRPDDTEYKLLSYYFDPETGEITSV